MTLTPQPEVTPRSLLDWARAQHANDPVESCFQALDHQLAAAPGHRLLTVLVYFEERGESQRAYSSQPTQYPRGGRKTLGQAPRMRQVLSSGEPFLGRTRQDIIDNYADHELLLSMGCECIINMPVRWGQRVLGTVNLLDAEGRYQQADLERISAWAQLSAPAFLAVIHQLQANRQSPGP
ncbi:MAG: GAF domain-containing protein [Comamonadaceae bacterium]|nr:GAF domain-containing protein [Comamonadaceae bacterium]